MKTGKIIFKKNDDLKHVLKCMPDGYGTYVIYNPSGEIIYIGKAGTVKNDGSITKQDIKKRLQNVRDNNFKGDIYWKIIMETYCYDFITIEYNIYEYPMFIPAVKECELLAQYFTKYNKLPLLNNNF